MANPFYVAPAGDMTRGLSGLSSVMGQIGEQKRLREKEDAAKLAWEQSQVEIQQAMESGDTDAINAVAIKYPQLSDQIYKGMEVSSNEQKARMNKDILEVLTSPEENVPAIFERRIREGQARGEPMEQSIQAYEEFLQSPEQSRQRMELVYAGTASPQEYGAYKDTLDSEASSKVVGGYLVDDKTGDIIFDSTGEGEREKIQDPNGRWRFVDDQSLVFPDVEAVEEGLSGKDRFNQAKDIRAEISKANLDFSKIANSWDRIAASADDPSAAGDMALIFNYMKMLDPGSTVREGEFATAQNTGGLDDRILSAYNRVRSGERLTVNQRSDFFGQAQNIFDASNDRAQNITDEYVRIAEDAGLNRDEVVVSRGTPPEIALSGDLIEIKQGDNAAFEALGAGEHYILDGVEWVK